MRLKTIYPILLLLTGSVAILPAATVAPEKEPARPLQPFLVELLDQERGSWIFIDANGQAMKHDGIVRLTGPRPESEVREVGILLDDPEFPGENAHAKKISFPVNANQALLDTGNFKATMTLKETADGTLAELSQIRLGSAMAAKGIPVMITLRGGGREIPLALEGKTPGLKLTTDRVGDVFEASEEPVLFVERPAGAAPLAASLLIKDYYRNRELSRIPVRLTGGRNRVKLPIAKLGSFVASVDIGGGVTASRRITRIPDARMVDPDQSFVGMNIFQHSIPYLTYQLPLFAKAGVRHLRPWLHWENTWANQEPRKGEFHTGPLDMLLRRMARYNQNYEYTLYKFSPVIGLKSARELEFSSLNEEQMKEWQAYLRRIVTHCKGQVKEWEVWNEPDLLNSSKDAGFSGDFYAKFLIATANAIREADPEARIHALSHAFILDWLREVGKTDIRPYVDVVTLHSYAGPAKFIEDKNRQQVIYDMGLWNVPQYFNEIAQAGFDLSEAYRKALPNNSERNQAIALPINYLQSLHLGGPKGRAYWFCSLGPRDGFRDLKWDSTNGLLYEGGLPKAAFPALAALANLCDGYTYLGRVEFENGVRFIALSGNRALAWRDRGEKAVRATELGALPGEQLTVYDLFGNPVASGAAETVTVDFTDGPRYVLGSKAMGEQAAAAYLQERSDREVAYRLERKVGMFPLPVELKIGESKTVSCPVMENAEVTVKATAGFPARFQQTVTGGKLEITLTGQSKGAGMLLFTVSAPDGGGSVVRPLSVSVEERPFLFDSGFELGRAVEFPTGPVRFLPNEGHRKPGCIRFDLSEGMRCNYLPKLRVRRDKPIRFQIALKGRLSPGATGHFKLALFDGPFGSSPWLGDAHPLDFNRAKKATAKFGGLGVAPEEIRRDRWQTFDVTIPGEQFTADNMAIVLAINFNNCGKEDYLLVDDFKITQEE